MVLTTLRLRFTRPRSACRAGATLTGSAETGQTIVEYGMILGLISVISLVAFSTLGGDVRSVFETLATELARI